MVREFIVVLTENGVSSITRCANFRSAVKMYRTLTELYGKASCQIFMEVVTYGEEI